VQTRITLTTSWKGSQSVAEYYTKMRSYADELATSDHPLGDEEFVSYILAGLNEDFDPMVSAVIAHVEPISPPSSTLKCSVMSCVTIANPLMAIMDHILRRMLPSGAMVVLVVAVVVMADNVLLATTTPTLVHLLHTRLIHLPAGLSVKHVFAWGIQPTFVGTVMMKIMCWIPRLLQPLLPLTVLIHSGTLTLGPLTTLPVS
jgi:hypothetical protein